MPDDATTRPLPPWSSTPIGVAYAPPPPARPLTLSVSDDAALRLLLLAAAGGLVAQALFVGQALGLNVVLWSAFVLGAAILVRRRDAGVDGLDLWIPAAALIFGAFAAIRADGPLLAVNTLVSMTLAVGYVAALRGISVTRSSLRTVAHASWLIARLMIGGAARLGGGLRPLRAAMARRSTAMRVLAGLLLALPLVLLFGALFAAADAVFAAQLARLLVLDVSLDDLLGRGLFALLAAWILSGVLLVAWLTDERVAHQPATEIRRRLGVIEAAIVLIAVDAVFAAFVVLQAAYLFGGLDTLAVSGMTYSEYARRGFFELIAVAAIAGVLLLLLDALVERRSLVFRVAAVALGVLTGAVLVSALARLALYQQAYGWTELRFYAVLAICWLGIGVVAAVGGLAFDRLRLVPRVLVIAALMLTVAANVVGPQRFVTEQNLARAIDPSLVPADGWSGLDFRYLSSLSNEAAPLFVAALPYLPADQRAIVERRLADKADRLRQRASNQGWPSFNLARVRALESLEAAGY